MPTKVETLPFLHVCVYVFSAQLHFAGSYFPSKQLPRKAQSKKRSYQKCKTSVMGCFAWIIFLRALEIIFSSSDSESAGKIRSRNCSICSFILAPGHRPNTSLCSISVPLNSKTFVLPLSVLESSLTNFFCSIVHFFFPIFLAF